MKLLSFFGELLLKFAHLMCVHLQHCSHCSASSWFTSFLHKGQISVLGLSTGVSGLVLALGFTGDCVEFGFTGIGIGPGCGFMSLDRRISRSASVRWECFILWSRIIRFKAQCWDLMCIMI